MTSSYLLADMGASYSIGLVYLGSTNGTSAATWRVRLSTSDATGAAGDAHDSGAISAGIDPGFGSALLALSSPAAGRYLRVDFSDSSLPYLEAGILRAMTKFQPGRNYAVRQQYLHRDFSRLRKGWDGQDWVYRGSMQRGVAFTLPAVSTSEWQNHGDPIARISGNSQDVVVCLDPAAINVGQETYFGLMEELPSWERINYGWRSASFKVWNRI